MDGRSILHVSEPVVEQREQFEAWLDGYPSFAESEARPAGNVQVGQAQYAVCAACHGAEGEGNEVLNAPRLAGQGDWYLERQLRNYKSGVRGAHEDDTYGAQMAPMAAILADNAAIDNVLAYIGTLPDKAAASTLTGDVSRGEYLYVTCKHCHGPDGQGIWAMNAPRLQGLNDWYIARQLSNYKQGIRGAHPQDLYGKQMRLMSGMIRSEQDISDLVAYINEL